MWSAVPATVIGLTGGHFVYQMLLSEPNFLVATERSFFQAVAIVCFVVICKINKNTT